MLISSDKVRQLSFMMLLYTKVCGDENGLVCNKLYTHHLLISFDVFVTHMLAKWEVSGLCCLFRMQSACIMAMVMWLRCSAVSIKRISKNGIDRLVSKPLMRSCFPNKVCFLTFNSNIALITITILGNIMKARELNWHMKYPGRSPRIISSRCQNIAKGFSRNWWVSNPLQCNTSVPISCH